MSIDALKADSVNFFASTYRDSTEPVDSKS